MSDYITTPRGNRITADQVDQLITTLKVISTWAHCQVEYHYEISEAVLRQIEKKANEALESMLSDDLLSECGTVAVIGRQQTGARFPVRM